MSTAAVRGAIIGGCVVYFLVVGMFERFTTRPVVTGVFSLGWAIIAALWLGAGIWAARGDRAQTTRAGGSAPARRSVGAGAVGGLVAGVVPAAFLLLADAANLRRVLINVTPGMINALAVGDSAAAGGGRIVVAAVVLGAAGAVFAATPHHIRRPLGTGMLALVLASLLEPLLRVAMANLGLLTSWLYRRGGLTVTGAVLAFTLGAAGSALLDWRRRAGRKEDAESVPDAGPSRATLAAWAAVALILLVLPHVIGSFLSEVAGTIGLYILLGLGLNIVVGSAGLLHLGYVAFFAVGAYATALLTSPASAMGVAVSFWVALPLVIAVTAVVGLIVGAPVLRLRGDYLAIVTLAFGEIARILALSDWLRPSLGGAQGILAVPPPTIGTIRFRDPQTLYYLILIACAVTAFISWRLEDSRVGRAWTAMREDEQVAQIMGVSITRYKLLAFALGAGIGSISGAFFAVKIGSVFPHSFNILVSITALSVVILGGIGSLRGVVLGAAVLVGLPDLLREFGEYRLLIYGAALVAVMILRPQGLLPDVRRQHELAEEERQQDQWLKRAGDDPEPAIAGGAAGAEDAGA